MLTVKSQTLILYRVSIVFYIVFFSEFIRCSLQQ